MQKKFEGYPVLAYSSFKTYVRLGVIDYLQINFIFLVYLKFKIDIISWKIQKLNYCKNS